MIAKRLLHSVFRTLVKQGSLSVTWPDGSATHYAGDGGTRVRIALRDWRWVRRLAANPGLAFGEAYMAGALEPVECTIYHALDLVLCNVMAGANHPLLLLHQSVLDATRRLRQINDAARARRHVAQHYDLDSRLYSLILDADLNYSCAYFTRDDDTLEQAQSAKQRADRRQAASAPAWDDGAGHRLRLGRHGDRARTRPRCARDRHHPLGRAATRGTGPRRGGRAC